MKKKINLLVLLLLATGAAFAQLNWYYHDFPSYTGNVTNPRYSEKTIIKTDSMGNLYSLVRTFDDASLVYLPRLEREYSGGGLAWQKMDASGAGDGANFYIVGLEVTREGQTFCLLSRHDNTYYRIVSYDIFGSLVWQRNVYPYEMGCFASQIGAKDIQLKNNKVYSLATLWGFPLNPGSATCRYTVLNLNTLAFAFSDTTTSSLAAKIAISSKAVWVIGYGAAAHKWFTQINKYNITSNHLINIQRTDGSFPARADRNEIPVAVTCSPVSDLPFIAGLSTDTLSVSGFASGSPASFDLMVIRPNAANTAMKLKVHDLTLNKKDAPSCLDIKSTGELLICGSTYRSGFATAIDPTTLARNWTRKIRMRDSTAFTASAFYNDNYVVVGNFYKPNHSINTIAARINTITGTYGGAVTGATNYANDKWQVTSACMNENAMVNFAGTSYNASINTNSLYTGQFNYALLPRIENEMPEETTLIDDFSMYPNPAVNELNINFNSKREATVKAFIINMQGQMMMQNEYEVGEGSNSYKVNLNGLVSGVYIFQLIKSTGEVKSHRFIKE